MEEEKLKQEIQNLIQMITDNSYWITWEDFKKARKLEFDTETVNDISKGELPFVFDLGGIYTTPNNEEQHFDYINTDIFYSDEKMTSCWCKSKIPLYKKITDKSEKKLKQKYLNLRVCLETIPNKIMCNRFKTIIRKNKTEYLCAFNIRFDLKAVYINFKSCNTNVRLLRNTPYIDTRLIAIRCFYDNPEEMAKYKRFCKKYDFLTPNGNCQTTMQSFGAYFFGIKYQEEHMGFFDSQDEKRLIEEEIPKVYKKYNRLHLLKVEVNNLSCKGISYAPFKIIEK